MKKIAIILHAEPGTHDSLGRALHALLYTQELNQMGHEAYLILDGGGTKWLEEFTQPEHKLAPLFETLNLEGRIRGVCKFCMGAFGVDAFIAEKEGIALIDEYQGHPSVANLITGGFQVICL